MITTATRFDELSQNEDWRNKVAMELNILLGRAQYFQETSNDSIDKEACKATLSIVERVREFEEIKTIEELLQPKHPAP